jgi:hypothetical protein
MTDVVVYSRRGCHLCEVLIEELLPLCRGRAEVAVRDVDTRSDWRERYGNDVPVVEIDGQSVCRHRLDRDAVTAALAAAR